MPATPKLKHGQISKADMQALTDFARAHGQDPCRLMLHPRALAAAGISADTRLPVARPEFQLVVDTAEQDHRDIVERVRMSGYFAVFRSLKQPVDAMSTAQAFAGDFVVLQWMGDDDDGDDDDAEYVVPGGYRVLVDIERKEISDLIASFKDNRRERQRAEQLNSSALRHVMLLEGATSQLEGRMAQWSRAVNGDYDAMTFAGELRVRQIATHAELVDVLINAVRYSARSVMDARAGIRNYLLPTFAGKDNDAAALRAMDDPHTALIGILTRVKGMSVQAAEAVAAAEFDTPAAFFRAMVDADTSAPKREALRKRLADVKVPTGSSLSSRDATRLGKRADRLLDLFVPARAGARVIDDEDDDDAAAPLVKRTAAQSTDARPIPRKGARPPPDWDESSSSSDDDVPTRALMRRKRRPPVAAAAGDKGWINTRK